MRTRIASAVIATVIAAGGLLVAAGPASAVGPVVGPFSTLTKCNGERALWRMEGYNPSNCWIGANGSDYYYFGNR